MPFPVLLAALFFRVKQEAASSAGLATVTSLYPRRRDNARSPQVFETGVLTCVFREEGSALTSELAVMVSCTL